MEKKLESNFDDRSKLLLKNDFTKLSKFKVAICGVGGVGSIIPLALLRSGIFNFLLIDFDTVDVSNLNRQFAYEAEDIGKKKVLALSSHMRKLRKEAAIDTVFAKIDKDFNFSLLDKCDYVFDCIDDIDAKVLLIKYCQEKNIKIISSLGMGNRLDSTKVVITRLNKTTGDPLAKKLRYLLKINNVDTSKIIVSFSSEEPIIKSKVIGSMVFVPNSSGLAMASYAIKELLSIGLTEE